MTEMSQWYWSQRDLRMSLGWEFIFFSQQPLYCVLDLWQKQSLWGTSVLRVAEQRLHSSKAFSVSHSALPVNRVGVHRELGGDTTKHINRADQNDALQHNITVSDEVTSLCGAAKGVNWKVSGSSLDRDVTFCFLHLY